MPFWMLLIVLPLAGLLWWISSILDRRFSRRPQKELGDTRARDAPDG
jgi:hypothetical protein